MAHSTTKAEVTLRYRLSSTERFEGYDNYGGRRQKVAIDSVTFIVSATRLIVQGSGQRLRKDGTPGNLRAAHVNIDSSLVPDHIVRQAALDYAATLDEMPQSLPLRIV